MTGLRPVTGKSAYTFWFRPQKASIRGLDMQIVSNALLPRFPFLNLAGLAHVKGLALKMDRWKTPHDPGLFAHDFMVYHKEHEDQSGKILFFKKKGIADLLCTSIYPDLPRVGNLGVTLFTLMLLRGNTFAGKITRISRVNVHSIKMAKKMQGFDPRIDPWPDELHTDCVLKVPRLTPKQVSAVEWYWRRILHMGAK